VFGLVIGFIGLFDTARDYTLQYTVTHTHTNVHSHVFTSRCSVTASNSGLSLSSGILNYPCQQLLAAHSNSSHRLNLSIPDWLTDWLTNSVTHQPSSLISLKWLTDLTSYLLSCLLHLGTDRTANTVLLLLYPIDAAEKRLLRSRYLITALV
jgi:hypothetical protein